MVYQRQGGSSSSSPRAAQLQPCPLKAKAVKKRFKEEEGAAGQQLVEAPCSKQGASESGWPTCVSRRASRWAPGRLGSSRAAAWRCDDATMRWRSNVMMQQCVIALYSCSLGDRLWWPQLGACGARGASAGSQLQESSWKEPWSIVALLASETWTHC